MAGQSSLNHNQLREFGANSPVLALRPQYSGSPQQDWCAHLQAFPHYRRELEDFVSFERLEQYDENGIVGF